MKGTIMEALNEVVQDAKTLEATAKSHAASETEEGISQEDIQGLTAAIADTQAKNKNQQDAMQTVGDLTDAQNKTMSRGQALIRKVQSAAKGVYDEDNKPVMKEFHIGNQAVASVKDMISELKYTKGVAEKHFADLKKAGLKQSDIDNFDSIMAELDDTDSRQENAKKKQKSATQVRDESLNALRKTMKKIRNKAKVIFAEEPETLLEFEPIVIRKSGKKQEPTPAPAQNSKAAADEASVQK
jgi:hypothetical protein